MNLKMDPPAHEIRLFRFIISRSYVGKPECNEVIERLILKEQYLSLHQFVSLAEPWAVIAAFIKTYNTGWSLARLGYRKPATARAAARAAADVMVLMSCPRNRERYTLNHHSFLQIRSININTYVDTKGELSPFRLGFVLLGCPVSLHSEKQS